MKHIKLYAWLLCLWSLQVGAQAPYTINKDTSYYKIPLAKIGVLCDSTGNLKFDDLLNSQGFTPLADSSTQKKPGLTYWLRFKIHNQLAKPKSFHVFLGRADYITLFQYNPETKSHEARMNGRRVPYPQKDIQGFINYGNYINLFIPRDTTLTFLVKTRNEKNFFVDSEIGAELLDQQEALTQQYFYNIGGAIFIGGLIIMALYTLVLAVSIRDVGYFLYMAFIFFGLLFYIYFYGFGIEWLWPNSPIWDIYSFLFVLSGTFFFWCLFTRNYLRTRLNLPVIDKILLFVAAINWLPAMLSVYDFFASDSPHLLLKIQILQNFIGLITMTFILYTACVAYFRQINSSKFYLWANLAMLLGSIILSLRFLGVVPDNFITSNAAQFGFFLQLILFSYGMGSRINRMQDQIAKKEYEQIKLRHEKDEERRRLIEEKNRELTLKVAERTEELKKQTQLLEEQNVDLHKLNKHKDLLFSIIGHDLRNPLANIKGVLTLMKEGLLSKEEIQQITVEVEKSIESVLTMLNNLLMWSLQQSGDIKMQPDELKLNDIIDENFILLGPQASQKGVELINQVPGETKIYADLQMILLVVRNLLSNAIKFTDSGGKVSVLAHSTDDKTIFKIADTGTGIEKDNLSKLFTDELYTTQGTAKEKGTGLGLKLCKDFIEDNNGIIEVESEEGQGTTFTITLPQTG